MSGLDGIELNKDRFMGLLVRAAPSAATRAASAQHACAFPAVGSARGLSFSPRWRR